MWIDVLPGKWVDVLYNIRVDVSPDFSLELYQSIVIYWIGNEPDVVQMIKSHSVHLPMVSDDAEYCMWTTGKLRFLHIYCMATTLCVRGDINSDNG